VLPNNPTGAVATRRELQMWVDYANANDAVIFFDAAYEAFITNPEIPHSIYQIDGAKRCAIEFRSFSKTAGFTGVRCGLVVVPEEVMGSTASGERYSFNKLWLRRTTPSSTAPPTRCRRRGSGLFRRGWRQTKAIIDYYMNNARIIREGLAGRRHHLLRRGRCPLHLVENPGGLTSWEFLTSSSPSAWLSAPPARALARREKDFSASRLWPYRKRGRGSSAHQAEVGQLRSIRVAFRPPFFPARGRCGPPLPGSRS